MLKAATILLIVLVVTATSTLVRRAGPASNPAADSDSAEVAAACAVLVTIPGSGRVESLNVSVAAAVLCWEFFGRIR